MDIIKLGDKVQDTVTGFKGTCVAITSWLNGCRRIGIQSTQLKDGVPIDVYMVDENQVKIITRTYHKPLTETGGPQHDKAALRR